MAEGYWWAKIRGLIREPTRQIRYSNSENVSINFWQELEEIMQKNFNYEYLDTENVHNLNLLADNIASASDRPSLSSFTTESNQDNNIEISHLLSGKKQNLNLSLSKQPKLPIEYLQSLEKNPQKLFWWLWRCLPEETCKQAGNQNLLLIPAEKSLPDSSIWSHGSMSSALSGALAGYDHHKSEQSRAHPFLASFSFSPVQELIKASRKMRDFWSGSWLLHYLAAKVSWKLALQYGPDSLLYPSLFQQPLIDHWLRKEYLDFQKWIPKPKERALLTAGFPNVLVLVLPKDKVEAAMQTAKNELLKTWQEISKLSFKELETRHWTRGLELNSNTWEGWLKSQWQTYWTAVPIGKENEAFQQNSIAENWLKTQNDAFNVRGEKQLFQEKEKDFLKKTEQNINIGSWWPYIFDQNRLTLNCVKNARTWQLPTAFGPRSTISGLGPVVHPRKDGKDWITEGDTKQYWQRKGGLFDGSEQLNATETMKRVLQKTLPELLEVREDQIAPSYPDLTAGVAGYLKTHTQKELDFFHDACQKITSELPTPQKSETDKVIIPDVMIEAWGIPWIDENHDKKYRRYHPRLLNTGWLLDDLEIAEDKKSENQQKLQKTIDSYYSNNNPTSWYVMAAGDGDGMSEWLKGEKLTKYVDYVSTDLTKNQDTTLQEFLQLPKRMGPSTHSALSRALLDFSNQLVPYLTEKRYAGRLIYSCGDDVLAYTNLWEWDKWLWDIRQCFRGEKDSEEQFDNQGDYWRWKNSEIPEGLAKRPLFTMGEAATISFGITIAHHSVPLAIALENLWEAEEGAKEHSCLKKGKKDAVQVRVLYGNGNILKATSKFATFHQWQKLINLDMKLASAIFEQAGNLYNQYPIPTTFAIAPWVKTFSSRRDFFNHNQDYQTRFENQLSSFLTNLWLTTAEKEIDEEIGNWLKLAAFVTRQRDIKLTK